MNARKRLIIMSLFILTAIMFVRSQTFTFSYDASGNQTGQTISVFNVQNQDDWHYEYSEMLTHYEITVYPNPTDGFLKVDIKNIEPDDKVVIDMLSEAGELISIGECRILPFTIDISNRPPGMYFLYIRINEFESIWKIIKK